MPPALALAKRTEDDERRLSTLSDGQLSRDGGLLTERLSRRYADRITGNQDARNIQLEGDRSRAEDLDMVQGISDFQQTQMGYQAALQSYAMVQKLSLFNYIS